LLLLRVGRARKVVVDRMIQIQFWKEDDLVKVVLCLVLLNLFIENRRFLGKRWFEKFSMFT